MSIYLYTYIYKYTCIYGVSRSKIKLILHDKLRHIHTYVTLHKSVNIGISIFIVYISSTQTRIRIHSITIPVLSPSGLRLPLLVGQR